MTANAVRVLLMLAAIALPSPTFAGETKLKGPEISAALTGHTVQGTGDDGKAWQQIFHKGGITYYSVGGAQSQGVWEVRGDQYCSQWPPNESWTCYDLMTDGKTLSFVSASGGRSSVTIQN